MGYQDATRLAELHPHDRRRAAFGVDVFLDRIGAQPVQGDECGELYRAELEGDEPLVVVKVRNSTPEPDGSTKDYFLRVPPTYKTARGAVAWTFGMDWRSYRPRVQT